MRTIVDWRILLHYTHELGKARKSRDVERIEEAKKVHNAYVKICLEADEMIGLGMVGDNRFK